MNNARIAGTGSYLPDRVMTNAEMESFLDTSDAWIRERTGIEQRHLVADGEILDGADRWARRQPRGRAAVVAGEVAAGISEAVLSERADAASRRGVPLAKASSAVFRASQFCVERPVNDPFPKR